MPDTPGKADRPGAPAGGRIATASGRGRTILIVDDNPEVREVVAVALAADGYHIDACGDGRAALNYLRSHTDVFAILLDLMPPVMAAAQFRAAQLRDRSLAWIPVIVMSGAVEAAQEAERMGARGFVRKPIDLDRLKEALHRLDGLTRRTPIGVDQRRFVD